MSDQSPRLSLPFILPAQAQKHVTHNEAIELLDLIVQLTLLSVSQVTPPATRKKGRPGRCRPVLRAIGQGRTA